ncbi:hypothetical protein PHIM7_306 [Sinorhizobium phage phiM7]|uniref:Uncharacterized protein n=3 Tax=Emdodecavirus TaxID=1980937 RepID=S5MBP7_9CAUD|nr:hypothetical protein AB690_gp205 [Sinorhizobium phage phiM12]YP_009212550.1 hypothetical protein AVT40_gp223 [Sinorhizobium phage phiN3]YP_009601431.1 hypothetical protein FDH46_gp172 [Sinorhizobium phage phiM7]AKF13211.1 hypothetical protein PHIM19_306 [Sinorhizobium phage phiM19]AGR48028.1 hypothetical protein SmphiM12_396 [Sinorhizobium phage phiM12]AKF12852.1 hypothetical protein PHIM7_306 [Sinorhizobium phage phiM7]AKF13573.1 hypothetical protein PHIN3_310 [Sinorhizobium phage phiN3]
MSFYKQTVRKNAKNTFYAFGREDKLDGMPTAQGGYKIYKLCENYDGTVRGGIRKTWRVQRENLSYVDAIKLMNKRLGREEFKPTM